MQQQVPHNFQQSMSFESTPVLLHTILAFEIFMTEWEKLVEEYSTLKSWIKISLRWAMKYYIQMDKTEAYVIAMCKLISTIITLI